MRAVPRTWLFCITALLLLMAGCKSGEKLYNKGRYDEAVQLFVKKLQKKPQDETSLRLLPEAYAQSLSRHEATVNNYMVSNDELKWEGIKQEYRTLQSLYNIIHASPAALTVVTPKDYSNAIAGARENAAETRYQRGVSLMQQNTKAADRQAYGEFEATLAQIRNYKDAPALMNQAFAGGVSNVLITPVVVPYNDFRYSADQFRLNLLQNLQHNSQSRFVQFFDATQAGNDGVRADYFVQMQSSDLERGPVNTDRYEQKISREITIQSRQKDSTGKFLETQITVNATLITVTKTASVQAVLNYRVVENGSNRVIAGKEIPGVFAWQHQYATFKGDERALSDAQKKLVALKDVPLPPVGDQYALCLKPIYDQVAGNLQQLSGTL